MASIPDSIIEPLIFNKLMTDDVYRTFINDNFSAQYFDNPRIRLAIEMSLKFFNKYSSLPSINTLNALIQKISEKDKTVDSVATIKEIEVAMSIPDQYDPIFVKDTVLDFIKTKAAYYVFLQNVDQLESKNEKRDISKCAESLQKISEISFDIDLGMDYYKDIDSHLDRISMPEAKIATGFGDLDKMTNGGLPKDGRCLTVFMAPTGIGKSLFMSNLAKNLMQQNLFPLIISLEMPEDVYAKRIDAHITEDDVNLLQLDISNVKNKIINFKALYPFSDLQIKEYPPGSITCNNLRSYVDKIVRMKKRKPDIFIVDYINLMLANSGTIGKNEDMYNRVGEITKQLRALSYYYKAPVVSGAQVNRNGFNTSEISLEDVSESAQILFHSDLIVGAFQVAGDREANKISTVILKNRLGGNVGRVSEYHINYKTLTIKNPESVGGHAGSAQINNVVDGILNV